MATVSNYHIKSRKTLPLWNNITEEWLLMIERYCRLTTWDAPFWYNERANTGLIASAAWRCGYAALEEFQHEKIDVAPDGGELTESPESRSGRCDLWIASENHHNYVEAKYRWLNMKSERLVEFASATLAKAVKDAETSGCGDPSRFLGVAFLPLFVQKERLKGEPIEGLISKTIQDLMTVDADLIAYTFPERLREHIGATGKNRLPGMAMLVKRAS